MAVARDRSSIVAAVAGAMARFIALNGMVVPNFLHELSKSAAIEERGDST